MRDHDVDAKVEVVGGHGFGTQLVCLNGRIG